MKDILLQHGDHYIECEIDGLELTYTYSSDPRAHYEQTLCNDGAYSGLKHKITNIYKSYEDRDEGFEIACELLQTNEFDEYFSDSVGRVYFDIRSREEMEAYETEAFDKVWLMRTRPCNNPEIEDGRIASIKRILNTYDDIPDNGYSDWECGYWNGIMSALRWAMGEEKDFLDT